MFKDFYHCKNSKNSGNQTDKNANDLMFSPLPTMFIQNPSSFRLSYDKGLKQLKSEQSSQI